MDSQELQGSTLSKTDEKEWELLQQRIKGYYEGATVPNVTKPSYYESNTHGIDVLDVIEMFNLGFHEGNIFKYICRWKNKNGLEDLQKAKEYLDRLIAKEKA